MLIRNRITSILGFVLVGTLFGVGAFYIQLYRSDRLDSVIQAELINTRRIIQYIERSYQLISLATPSLIEESSDVLFVKDEPCNDQANGALIVSKKHVKDLTRFDTPPVLWLGSAELLEACKTLPTAVDSVRIIEFKVVLHLPYAGMLMRTGGKTRLAVINMDDFKTGALNTAVAVNEKGDFLWALDGKEYFLEALDDLKLPSNYLNQLATRMISSNDFGKLTPTGEGMITYARSKLGFCIISIISSDTAMASVNFAAQQLGFLMLGVIGVIVLILRQVILFLTSPLAELQVYAKRVGEGNLTESFPNPGKGEDEVTVVKRAFNEMVVQIQHLIEATREKAALEAEINLAEKIQHFFLPPTKVQILGHTIHSYSATATHCSGDWWGFCELPGANGKRLVVAIGDVTGHGVASALVTASAKGAMVTIQSWMIESPQEFSSPSRVLQELNKSVYLGGKTDITMTLFIAIFDSAAETVTVANAGHNLPYLVSQELGGKIKVLPVGKSGVPVGQSLSTQYSDDQVHPWKKGSIFFGYTDGLIEGQTKEGAVPFDRKALSKLIRDFKDLKGDKNLATIRSTRNAACKMPDPDDTTVVLVQNTQE